MGCASFFCGAHIILWRLCPPTSEEFFHGGGIRIIFPDRTIGCGRKFIALWSDHDTENDSVPVVSFFFVCWCILWGFGVVEGICGRISLGWVWPAEYNVSVPEVVPVLGQRQSDFVSVPVVPRAVVESGSRASRRSWKRTIITGFGCFRDIGIVVRGPWRFWTVSEKMIPCPQFGLLVGGGF